MDRLRGILEAGTNQAQEVLLGTRVIQDSRRRGTPRQQVLKSSWQDCGPQHVRDNAHSVRRPDISTRNVQGSGEKSQTHERREHYPARPDLPLVTSTAKLSPPLNSWTEVKDKLKLTDDRYNDFNYLRYLDLENKFVNNYFEYHIGVSEPIYKDRLSSNLEFWKEIGSPKWIQNIIYEGFKVDFIRKPPKIFIENYKSVLKNKSWVQEKKYLSMKNMDL